MNDDRLDKYEGWETRERDGGIEKGKNRGKETCNTKRGWKEEGNDNRTYKLKRYENNMREMR